MKSVSATLLFCAMLAPHTAQAVDLVPLNDFPGWFTDALARTTEIKTSTDLAIDSLGLTVRVPGKASLLEQGDGMSYYQMNIGTGSPVECYVFTEFDGTATSFYAIMEHSLQSAANLNNKSLTGAFNFAIDSDVVSGVPYIGLDTLYTLGEGSEKVSGTLKGLAARTDRSLQICLHNEIGYRDSFMAVFSSLIEGINAQEQDNAFFEPVYKMTLNGTPIGYSRETYTYDEDGDVNIETDSVFLVPVDASSVSRSDAVVSAWSTPDGALINANEYTIDNGVVSSQFSITYQDDAWQVQGSLQNKPVSATLDHDGWLLSDFGGYLATASLADADTPSSTYSMWVPEADPTSVMAVTLSKQQAENAYRFDAGPLSMDYTADAEGVMKHAAMEMGGLQVKLELVHRRGSPVTP
ncbi:hypothetical protein [Alteromonas sp. CYL-A6]|uniref:hypothetical protein n=1 Tax=Alteromonas nitratireducens TaxID=3390813 RepID=UPI0034B801C8